MPSVAIFYMVMACNVPSVTKLLDMLLILFPLPFCEMELKLILLFMNPFIILFSLQLYARSGGSTGGAAGATAPPSEPNLFINHYYIVANHH